MGNNSTTVGAGDVEILPRTLEFIKKFNDIRFGDIKLLRERATGIKIFQKDYVTNSARVFEATLNGIKQRASVNHPNILRILGYTSKKESAFCANYFKITVFCESYVFDLENDIIARRQKQDYFSEAEIWNMLDCIVAACAHLEAAGEVYGDICPFNIFVGEDGEYKIADACIFNGASVPSTYGLEGMLVNKGRYYSPLAFSHYGERSETDAPQHDGYKSDVFSLGLTILEAITLQNMRFVYNWNTFKVDIDKIKEILKQQLEQKIYSVALIETISLMLNADEAQRPDFLKLDTDLSLYRADIRTRTIKNGLEHSPVTPIQTEQNEPREENKEEEEDDLDARIRAAIEKSELTIKNFPVKHIKENVLAYYEHLVDHKGGTNEIKASQKLETDDRAATSKAFEETVESTNRGGNYTTPIKLRSNQQANAPTAGNRIVTNTNSPEYNSYSRNAVENSNTSGYDSVMKPVVKSGRNESSAKPYLSVYGAQGNLDRNNAITTSPQGYGEERSNRITNNINLEQTVNLDDVVTKNGPEELNADVKSYQPPIESKAFGYNASGASNIYSKPISQFTEANIRASPVTHANSSTSTNNSKTSQHGTVGVTASKEKPIVQPITQNSERDSKNFYKSNYQPNYNRNAGNTLETNQLRVNSNLATNSTNASNIYGSAKYVPNSYTYGRSAQK